MEDGFKSLEYPVIPQASPLIAVKTETLQKEPDMVYGFVKATLKGHLLFAKRTNEVIPSVMKFTQMTDRNFCKELFSFAFE